MKFFLKLPLWCLAQFLFYLIWFLGLIFYLCPFLIKNSLAYFLSFFWFYILRVKKKIFLVNISLAFPRKKEESMQAFQRRCEDLARKNMQHIVLCVFESLERFHWTKDLLNKQFFVQGEEHVHKALEGGKGVLFLTSHLGNWEAMIFVASLLDFPLATVTRYLRNSFFDDIWVQSRNRMNIEFIKERGSGLQIAKTLQKNKSVGFMMDQHTGEPHGSMSSFLGVDAMTPKGLTILAARLETKVLPAYIHRDEKGHFHLRIEKELIFNFKTKKASPEEIKKHQQLVNDKIASWVYEHPEQYLWMHKRFKRVINYKKKKLPWS